MLTLLLPAQDQLTLPGLRVYNGTSVPDLIAAPSAPNDTCNSYIPNDSTMDRFAYIVNFLADNGLYVVRHSLLQNMLRCMATACCMQLAATVLLASDTCQRRSCRCSY